MKFLESLGEEEKQIFEMRYIAELSYREIADILGKSEGSLRVAVSRIKQKIKSGLKK